MTAKVFHRRHDKNIKIYIGAMNKGKELKYFHVTLYDEPFYSASATML